MRWPWSRKHNDVNTDEAKHALADAQKERAKAESYQPQVDKLSRDLAKHASENNFSRLVEEAMHQRRR